eukprot:scaffold7305_cov178-Ochromonas_danica.AAC.7
MTTTITTTTTPPPPSILTTISSSSIPSIQTDEDILLKTNKLLLEEKPTPPPTTTAAVQQQQEGQQLEKQQQQQRPSFEPTFKYHHQIFGSRAPPKHVALTVVRPFMGDFYEKNKEGKEVITQEAFRFIVETSELVANTSAALSTATPPPLYGYQLEDNSQQPIMNNRFEFDPSLIAKINAAESRVDDDGNVIYRVEVDEDELASLYSTSSRDKLAAEEEYIRHYPELKDKREWRSSSRKKKQMRYRVNYWHQIKLSLAMMLPRLPVVYGRTWAVLLILGIYVPLVVTLLRTVIGLLPPIPLFLQRVWLFVELFVLLPVMINWACTKHPQDNKLRLGLLLFTWEKKLGWQMDRIRAWWARGKTTRNH